MAAAGQRVRDLGRGLTQKGGYCKGQNLFKKIVNTIKRVKYKKNHNFLPKKEFTVRLGSLHREGALLTHCYRV